MTSSVSLGPRSYSQGTSPPPICTSVPSREMRRRPESVLLRAAAAGTADTGLDQNTAHRAMIQVDALPFSEQLGEVAVVGTGVAVAGQLHHCGGTVLAVSREETLGMAFNRSYDLGGLGYGKPVFQNAVEHLNPGLFLLIQLHIPDGDEILADQLAGDRIAEQQHNRRNWKNASVNKKYLNQREVNIRWVRRRA